MVPRKSVSFAASLLAVASLAGITVATAQSDADVKLMDKARALYFTGPAPKSVSCDAVIDWDDFFKKLNQPQTDETKARTEKLKQIKISVASRGGTNTTVNVTGGDAAGNMSNGIEQQLRGFFQMYWSEAYGDLLAKKGDAFQLTTTSDGYVQSSAPGGTSVSVTMNREFLITEFAVHLPQFNATVKPTFEAGTDKLLRLRKINQVTEMGTSKLEVNIGFDYQKVGAYEIPHHLEMSVPGSYSFLYTLDGCKVDEPAAVASAATPADTAK